MEKQTREMIKWRWFDTLLLIVALIPIGVAVYFFPQLPGQMAVHFNLAGEPDGYQGKLSFIIFSAVLLVGLPLLMKYLMLIDPKGKKNYKNFIRAYQVIRVSLTVFLSGAMLHVYFFNLGYILPVQPFVLAGLGIMFLVIGNYMGQIRTSYFIGIRTPWTLENEQVWRKTHRLTGILWVALGIVTIICAFLPGVIAAWVVGIGIGISVVYPIVYSYVVYRRITK